LEVGVDVARIIAASVVDLPATVEPAHEHDAAAIRRSAYLFEQAELLEAGHFVFT